MLLRRTGKSGKFSDDYDPYTNETLLTIRLANEGDLNEAFAAAAAAQPKWQNMLPSERSAILRRQPILWKPDAKRSSDR